MTTDEIVGVESAPVIAPNVSRIQLHMGLSMTYLSLLVQSYSSKLHHLGKYLHRVSSFFPLVFIPTPTSPTSPRNSESMIGAVTALVTPPIRALLKAFPSRCTPYFCIYNTICIRWVNTLADCAVFCLIQAGYLGECRDCSMRHKCLEIPNRQASHLLEPIVR